MSLSAPRPRFSRLISAAFLLARYGAAFAMVALTATVVVSCATPRPITPGSTRTSLLSEYLKQWKVEVPEGVEVGAVTDLYLIPHGEVSEVILSRRNLPRAREVISTGLTQSISLRKLGDQHWLSADMAPSSLWPLIKQYWETEGEGIVREDALAGVLETQAVSEDGTPVSYLITIEAGLRSSSAELHLRRTGDEADRGRVVDRYRAILKYLGAASELSSSLLVQHLDFRPKMSTGTDEAGYPYLLLRVTRARAWSLLATAVSNLSWPRLGADRSKGVIQVEFRETILRENWLKRWPASQSARRNELTVPLPPTNLENTVRVSRRSGTAEGAKVLLTMQEAADGIRVQPSGDNLSFTAAVEIISELVQAVQ